MNVWTPFWRWTALGVLGVLTLAWVAHSDAHGVGRFGPTVPTSRAHGAACAGGTAVAWATSDGGRQVCVNAPDGTLSVKPDGTVSVTDGAAQNAALSAAAQRERAALQRQEAELQAQDAQLNARIAALQARLNSLGN